MMKSVSFIGLGSIGFPIAEHISKKFHLYYYARRQDVIEKANAFGVFCGSINELSRKSSVMILFLSDYSQCVECLSEVDYSVVDTVLIGSTISPEQIELLHQQFPANIIDIPVSGGVKGAINGTLTTMVSGPEAVVTEITPILETYSGKIVFVDEMPGKAEALKAIIQLMVGINTIATSEAFVLASKLDLDLDMVYNTVLNSSGYSKIFENRGMSLIAKDFSKRGNMQTMRKDLNIILDMSKSCGLDLKLIHTSSELFNDAKERIPDDLDFSAIMLMYESGD